MNISTTPCLYLFLSLCFFLLFVSFFYSFFFCFYYPCFCKHVLKLRLLAGEFSYCRTHPDVSYNYSAVMLAVLEPLCIVHFVVINCYVHKVWSHIKSVRAKSDPTDPFIIHTVMCKRKYTLWQLCQVVQFKKVIWSLPSLKN